MKFGVREICDVVLKAKATQKVGNKIFYKHEPVIYFDSLKTSSMEGAATTVYAQGGRGNARLAAWEGERTVTFTMEDALISPEGFMILSGAGLVQGSETKPIIVHTTEKVIAETEGKIRVSKKPYTESEGDLIYVMLLDANGDVSTEPYIYTCTGEADEDGKYELTISNRGWKDGDKTGTYAVDAGKPKAGQVVFVDYYVAKAGSARQIDITPDKFGGNYYLEASTLFRNTNGVDMPAEFIIPNCKIQSNFTFTMASSGDPSTFTFTMDAFPDYTRFDPTTKVLAAIQIVEESEGLDLEAIRKQTHAGVVIE